MREHADLLAALPHRYPLLLVDRVLDLVPGRSIRTIKAITGTEPCYAAVPEAGAAGRYAYPRSLMIESFGQSAVLLWLGGRPPDRDDGRVLMFAGARGYRFEGDAYPGDVLRHEVRLESVVADTAFVSGETWAGDRRVATVASIFATRRPARPTPPTVDSAVKQCRQAGKGLAMTQEEKRFEELREMVAEVLEVEPEELTDTGDFVEDYEADSLRAIEILARLDKHFKVEIPQAELPELRNLKAVHAALARHANGGAGT